MLKKTALFLRDGFPYLESFCDKNLATWKVFAICDSADAPRGGTSHKFSTPKIDFWALFNPKKT